MANITQKPNGTYLVRISCGRDIMTGKQILRGRIFKPSKPDLSQERFQKELNEFIEDFTDELQCERNRKKPENKIVSDFAKEYLSIKKTSLSPTSYVLYERIIEQHICSYAWKNAVTRHKNIPCSGFYYETELHAST